jgi:hypothetical protein
VTRRVESLLADLTEAIDAAAELVSLGKYVGTPNAHCAWQVRRSSAAWAISQRSCQMRL